MVIFHPLYSYISSNFYRGPSGHCSWWQFLSFQAVEVLVVVVLVEVVVEVLVVV